MTRTILHVDMDAFFASVEAREDPRLRGRPVVVGADPKGGRGRGVVAAASYEARAYGIHSAMPISEAWRRCPHAAYRRPRLGLYGRISDRIFAIFERYTDAVEPLSLDEAFLDVTGSRALFGDGVEIARRIRAEVLEEERLTASVGVAPSKFLAKLGSDLEKPDGLVSVPPGSEREFLGPLEVARLWGAGEKSLARFHELGVRTIGDVAVLPLERLTAAFGEARGRHFHRLARGHDDREVVPDRERKSLGRESTFGHDVQDRDTVLHTLLELCDQVARRLRRRRLAGATVTVKLRWAGFETVTRQETLEGAVNTTERIWPVARRLLRRADRPGSAVRLVGVSVSALRPAGEGQLSLFSNGGRRRDERVADAVDRLAERFGDDVLVRAALLDRHGPGSPATTLRRDP